MAASLLIVGECPVLCGMVGVVVLRSIATGRLVFFAPCCGLAWHLPPRDRVDEIHSLDDIEPGSLALPTREELAALAPALVVIREEPVDDWIEFLPRLVRA
jgi:hypothetical protein